ncbi:MAG: hypothetical protein KDA61_20520 [Planctomycetales bacterium]|nr:hypothetical protein [Planctomycetales bacterium]
MGSFDDQIDKIPPLTTVVTVAALLALAVMAMPPRRRLQFALAQMSLIMAISRLQSLGSLAILAKILTAVGVGLVAASALAHPGPRRRTVLLNWASVVASAIGIVVVTGADDWQKAVFLRGQAFLLTLTAIWVSQTIVEGRDLRDVFLGFFWGAGAGTVVAMSALIVEPSVAFAAGLGRFQPYGCNPVQIGVLFACAAPLGVYFSLHASRRGVQQFYMTLAALAMAGAVLTVSRMAIGAIALTSAPCMFRMARRPLVMIGLLLAATALAWNLMARFEDSNFAHLQASQESHRLAYTEEVMGEVRLRPWFGLLTSHGELAHPPDLNAHNSHVELLYLGGVALAAPNALLMLLASYGAFRVTAGPRRREFGKLLCPTVALLFATTVINSMVNFITNYPSYTFTFVHALLLQFFLMAGSGRPSSPTASLRQKQTRAPIRVAAAA